MKNMTQAETDAHARFTAAVERGTHRVDAAHEALTMMLPAYRTAAFVDALSGGALMLVHGKIKRRGTPLTRFGRILGVEDVWGKGFQNG